MALHPVREEALLAWINGLQLDDPVKRIIHLQDGNMLLKLVYKLKGEDPSQAPVHLPQAERLSIISEFLRDVCHVEECILLTLAKGTMLELELTKVVLLLCDYGTVNRKLLPEVGFENEVATMLRYVQQGASGRSLREGLDKLLSMSSLTCFSSSSVSSVSEDDSPFFSRSWRPPFVNFVELNTVASSSLVGSPLQELMSTPQVQVKRLRKELAREEDVRDELERELAERVALLSEKEGQIGQLQHRLQRLQKEQEEMENEHKASLIELQQKNDGLLTRVHELSKQCRDLKTDNSQKERRIDVLMEENGTLAAQARNAFSQIARVEEEVAKLTEAHDLSQKEWGSKGEVLQRELTQALTDREYLTEQIQILQGKISVLEDELMKLCQQPQEKGEVLGPIVEWEKLKQELSDLTRKLSHLEEIISVLQKEKATIETLLAEERLSFAKETQRLEECISELQQSVLYIQAEKEAQEQVSMTKQQTLSSQIAVLETDLAHLQQLEIQLTAEITASAELRQQRCMLEAKVASLEDMVNVLQTKCQNMEAENAAQQEAFNAVRADLQNTQASLLEYEKRLTDHQKVVDENTSLRARISALDDTIANLQTEIDAERKRGDAIHAAKEQHEALMEERFQKQEEKAHEMFTELQTLSQELRKMKHQKLDADSCIKKLTQEGIDLKASLLKEQDQGQSQLSQLSKAKKEREMELQQIIADNQSKISALHCKIDGTIQSLMQSESEISVLKQNILSKDGELVIQQEELAHLQNKVDSLQRQLLEVEQLSQQLGQDVVSKDGEVQHLKMELEQKEGEIHSLKVSLQSIDEQYNKMYERHQQEVVVIAELQLKLAEAEKLVSEKVKNLEALVQQLKDLKEELCIERQKVVTLENNFKVSEEAHVVQEQAMRLEVAQLQQDIDGYLKKLEGSLNEICSLKEEISHQQDVVLQNEQKASLLRAQNKSLEENFAQLQNKLAEAKTLATERQSELLKLKEEVQLQEHLREEAQEIEATRRRELERNVAELLARVQELTLLASEREIQLGSLYEKLKEQEDSSQKLVQKSEEALQKELENIVELKEQLESSMSQTAAKNKLLESSVEKLKQMELRYQQKETLATEACQAKEALERTVNELYSKLKQDFDSYQQDLETLKKEKVHLSLVNESLQSEWQTLMAQSKEQQDTLNAFKANQQSTKNEYEQDLEALKKEKEHVQHECQNLQTENKLQQEALCTLKADLHKTQEEYHKSLDILKKENEHLSSGIRSLQIECQNLQAENKSQCEAVKSLKAGLQDTQNGYQQETETLKNEQERLSAVIQSLQSECQALQVVKTRQQVELHALKADLQENQNKYEKDMESIKTEKQQLVLVKQNFQMENSEQRAELNALRADLHESKNKYEKDFKTLECGKEHLSSVIKSLQTECQTLQAENKGQEEMLNSLKADLQKAQNGYLQELEALKKERQHLCSVNQSLQNECHKLQSEKMGQQEDLHSLKATLHENKNKFEEDVETFMNEREQLVLVNQSLQTGQIEKQEELNALKVELQEIKNKYENDVETLKNENEQLASLKESLVGDLEAARQVGAELVSVKVLAEKRENELENQVKELQVKIKEFSTKVDEREAEIRNLHNKVEQQEDLRLSAQEFEMVRAEFETKVAQLQVQVDEGFKLASERKSESCLLQDQLKESEKQKQDASQSKEVLKKAVSELHLKQKQALEEYLQQLEALAKEKAALVSKNQSLQAEKEEQLKALNDMQSRLQQELKTLKKEKELFSSVNRSLQQELDASQRLGAELEEKLMGQTETIQGMKEAVQRKETQNQELQKQFKVKADAVEHYKVQVEKAKTHYDGKKQLLLEEQEARKVLQATLETSENEVKALRAELKLVSVELEKVNISEKNLMMRVKSLETQLDYADRQLREQRKQSVQVNHNENVYVKIPENTQNTSTDSLDVDLDDSLNAAGKQSVPGKSSTPVVRSSERLAAKRHAQDVGSLETLYFTPMMPRGKKRGHTSQDQQFESSLTSLGELTLESTKKPSSSVQRRRTTQVINITMTKKTPLGGEGGSDESFFSLHSAQSQPSLASHKSHPVSAEVFEDPNKLLSLPGYRRSNAHATVPPRALSAFCLNSESEPDVLSDDWMRLAELQSRNKACLPHLKSSYPLESRPSLGFSRLPVTDEDVRTGDPTETIRRASMIPSQLKDSVAVHRLSVVPPSAAAHARTSQVSKLREVRSTRSPLASKRPAGQIQDSDTPDAKKVVSCFSRTPKGKRSLRSQSAMPSSANRRQSMAFVIDNTPKKVRGDSRLQRGINRLLPTSTKSPRVTSSAKKLMKLRMKM